MEVDVSIRKVRGYPKGVEKITSVSLKKHEKTAAKWNVQQMETGLRPDGSLQDYYSPVSVEKFGKEPGRIKLKDTGAFHESVLSKTKAKKNELIFEGVDRYDLERNYGPIFGLTEKNIDKLKELVFKDLVIGLKNYWK